MAKLKQIAIEPAADGEPAALWGLCRNGSLWMRELNNDGSRWIRMAEPPDSSPALPRRKRAAAAEIELPSMRISGGAAE